jgi:outer membrane protein assembly factor BamE (lipoprotein component of BamABCDE complex)
MICRSPVVIISLAVLSCLGVAQSTPKPMSGLELMKKIAELKVGASTRDDVRKLLGDPFRSTNDADCEAKQYGESWDYAVTDTDSSFLIHITFSDKGTVSLIAKIPKEGKIEVLAFVPAEAHHH